MCRGLGPHIDPHMPASLASDRDSCLFVSGGRLGGGGAVQVGAHLPVEGVQCLAAVDGDNAHAIGDTRQHCGEHAG